MIYRSGFGTILVVQDINHYAVQLANGERVEAVYYGADSVILAVGDRVFVEYIGASNLWTISAQFVGGAGMPINHNDLTGVTPDQHHAQLHAINSASDHSAGTLGDIIYAAAAGAWARLTGNITTTRKFLTQTGTGAASAAPEWYDHEGAADPHTGYRLESADHTHQSTGAQAGQLDHGLALTGLTDDDHTQYLKEEASGGVASEVPDHAHSGVAEAGGPLLAANTHASPAADTHHPQAHGASDHTNRTRTIWLPPRVFGAVQGSPILVTFGPDANNLSEAWALDSAALEDMGITLVLPSDWVAGGAITFKFYWAADTDTDTGHNCCMIVTWTGLADGDSINKVRDVLLLDYFPVPSTTAKIMDIATVGSSALGLAAGSLLRLQVGRGGQVAGDTMTGDALLLGVLIEYTADM